MAQLFLGVRIQCAKCHNHPYEAITQDDYYGLAAYFGRVGFKGVRYGRDDEIVFLKPTGEVKHAATNKVVQPAAFGTPATNVSPEEDFRQHLADWLASPKNRYFARSTVNRIWYHLLGQGIVEPIDDFRESNPPANSELLDGLAEQFIAAEFRFKPIIRTILNSNTYQLNAKYVEQSKYAANSKRYFTSAKIQMLSAEQILDAVCSATGVPETYVGYPVGTRAIELADGETDHHFLRAFSKPVRDVRCDCARETDPSLNQVIHMINNPSILDKLSSPQGRLAAWLKAGKTTEEIVELIYLATLTRRPRQTETELATKHIAAAKNTVEGLRDLQHALLNSNEFLLRH